MAREVCDVGERILRGQVGDYTAMKPLSATLNKQMQIIALYDSFSPAAECPLFDNRNIEQQIKLKNQYFITAAYLYCNWRVWAVYKRDEKMAREYQKVCDMIDATIFDEWKGTEKLKYFIRETD